MSQWRTQTGKEVEQVSDQRGRDLAEISRESSGRPRQRRAAVEAQVRERQAEQQALRAKVRRERLHDALTSRPARAAYLVVAAALTALVAHALI